MLLLAAAAGGSCGMGGHGRHCRQHCYVPGNAPAHGVGVWDPWCAACCWCSNASCSKHGALMCSGWAGPGFAYAHRLGTQQGVGARPSLTNSHTGKLCAAVRVVRVSGLHAECDCHTPGSGWLVTL